ncbi:MAG: 50S ribosomal protein L3 [Euryarchaeota archaeon]|nr:50S ribosomal protein L3 [Euryarchaeota archaeon]
MAKRMRPRRGSLAYSPRKRARRPIPRIRRAPASEKPRVLGFAGYKAGMTHLVLVDEMPKSMTLGTEIPVPVTILEAPPLRVVGLRLYRPTSDGWVLSDEARAKRVRLVVETHPEKVGGIPKKNPERFEVQVGGPADQALAYARGLVGKEIGARDVLADGDYVDVSAVTKGKGLQGPVRRWGVMIQNAKAQRSSRGRHVGSLGPWHPAHVSWRVPQSGQMGYHQRTEYHKRVLKVGADGSEVTPQGGFLHYGTLRNPYILIQGSVPGPTKRLVHVRPAIRPRASPGVPKITYVSRESKQGVRPGGMES